jgi:hypothetical protein
VDNITDKWSTYELALSTLAAEARSADAPTLVLFLRKKFPTSDVRELNLAVETFIARRQASDKLGEWAAQGFFSLSLLQQASRLSIARYRASFFTGRKHVLEIGTGTGSDTAALARVVEHVTTIDGDPEASELAQRNLALQGITNVTFLVGDVQHLIDSLPKTFDGLFADPARRTKSGERFTDGDEYSPPLSFVMSLEIGALRAIKVSPGLFVDPCPAGWSRQFVGCGEECLEQTLWYGSSIVDSSIAVTDRDESWSPPQDDRDVEMVSEIGAYLVEAHATINRSQKLGLFFNEHGAHLFDPDVAYGTATTALQRTGLCTSYKVLESLPYAKKTLKAALSSRGWSNRTEFKKRNFPGDIEAVRSDMELPKHSHTAPFGVVLLFRYHGKPWAVIAERTYE